MRKKNEIPVVDLSKPQSSPEEIKRLQDEIDRKIYMERRYPDVELTDERECLNRSDEIVEQLTPAEIEKILADIDKEYEASLNVRRSIHVGGGYIDDDDLAPRGPSFSMLLSKYISDKNMTNPEFYKAAWIDRRLFSAIKNDIYYKPKKETVVACCLGLKLNSVEAQKLLESAGYTLSNSIQWDRIINYCIEHEIFEIDSVNQILFARNENCIGC